MPNVLVMIRVFDCGAWVEWVWVVGFQGVCGWLRYRVDSGGDDRQVASKLAKSIDIGVYVDVYASPKKLGHIKR